jgi:uncharacterized repeat protein (TIGR01451 family)
MFMKLFSRIRKLASKRLFGLAVAAIAIALPVSSISAASITLEGSLGVANVTAGDTTYKPSVNASYDQVVKIQAFYHNRENPDSGKIANNLNVKIDIPEQPGAVQTVTTTIKGDDTNVINDSVTVNLGRDDAYLEYIPGSAVWRHNAGTNENVNIVEQVISDNVVLGEGGVVVENAKPCYNFAATVTVLARVKIPSVGVSKKVRKAGTQDATTTNLNVAPGTRLEYVVTAKNLSNTDLTNVYLRDPLPKGLTYVAGTAKKYYGSFNGTPLTAEEANAFFNGKKNVGTLKPGASAFITFEAQVAESKDLACGAQSMKNIAVVDTDQTGEYNNSATVNTSKECANVPAYSCDLLKIEKTTGRTVKVADFKTSQSNGATFKHVVINWGDNTTALTTNNAVGQTHTYAADGTYNIVATATFTVDGQDKTATSQACTASVTYSPTTTTTPPTPGKLPDTGAGDVIGLFAAVTIAGAVAHRYFYGKFSS